MLNSIGFSFVSHIAINTYFFLKKTFFKHGKSARPRAIPAGATIAISIAIILSIAAVEFYSVGSIVYFNFKDSPNARYIKQALAIEPATAAFHKKTTDPRPSASPAAAVPPIPVTLANMVQDIEIAPVFSKTVAKGDNLWDIAHQYAAASVGTDFCGQARDEKACEKSVRQYLAETTAHIINKNYSVTHAAITPGMTVSIDSQNNIHIEN